MLTDSVGSNPYKKGHSGTNNDWTPWSEMSPKARLDGDHMRDLQLLTVEDLCSLLRVSRAAIYSQRLRGEMPGALGVKLGKRIFFRPVDIDNYIESQLPGTLPIPR